MIASSQTRTTLSAARTGEAAAAARPAAKRMARRPRTRRAVRSRRTTNRQYIRSDIVSESAPGRGIGNPIVRRIGSPFYCPADGTPSVNSEEARDVRVILAEVERNDERGPVDRSDRSQRKHPA